MLMRACRQLGSLICFHCILYTLIIMTTLHTSSNFLTEKEKCHNMNMLNLALQEIISHGPMIMIIILIMMMMIMMIIILIIILILH